MMSGACVRKAGNMSMMSMSSVYSLCLYVVGGKVELVQEEKRRLKYGTERDELVYLSWIRDLHASALREVALI